jgi:hypothetical protein
MHEINIKKVLVSGEKLILSTRFRKFEIGRQDISSFKVLRIMSLFDEIGILLECSKSFMVTERAFGFFELAEFLCVQKLFGLSWYIDAESGRLLEHVCAHSRVLRIEGT